MEAVDTATAAVVMILVTCVVMRLVATGRTVFITLAPATPALNVNSLALPKTMIVSTPVSTLKSTTTFQSKLAAEIALKLSLL